MDGLVSGWGGGGSLKPGGGFKVGFYAIPKDPGLYNFVRGFGRAHKRGHVFVGSLSRKNKMLRCNEVKRISEMK